MASHEDTTGPEDGLFAEMLDRAAVLVELDGPQIEAWVSGLLPLLEEGDSGQRFVAACLGRHDAVGALLCRAIAELADEPIASLAAESAASLGDVMPANGAEIGGSTPSGAWQASAPFGESVVVGFAVDGGADHSILVELEAGGDGELIEDLHLAGPAAELLAEAAGGDEDVLVTTVELPVAVARLVAAWEATAARRPRLGPGIATNEYFVRRRLTMLSGRVLGRLTEAEADVDVRRGMTDAEFEAANRAALSTLRAALGSIVQPEHLSAMHLAWVAVIRGDLAGLGSREREGLLWLEWADWLGAGIGLARSGAGAVVDGSALVDLVNRCPEVSSTVSRVDRDYAEWAFGVAIDHLGDVGIVVDGTLSAAGHAALAPAMLVAWS